MKLTKELISLQIDGFTREFDRWKSEEFAKIHPTHVLDRHMDESIVEPATCTECGAMQVRWGLFDYDPAYGPWVGDALASPCPKRPGTQIEMEF